MNNKFDELTKGLAQSVTRRAALKKFGVGLAGMALAGFGIAGKVGAAPRQGYCTYVVTFTTAYYTGTCLDFNGCVGAASADCPRTPLGKNGVKAGIACGGTRYDRVSKCSFTV